MLIEAYYLTAEISPTAARSTPCDALLTNEELPQADSRKDKKITPNIMLSFFIRLL